MTHFIQISDFLFFRDYESRREGAEGVRYGLGKWGGQIWFGKVSGEGGGMVRYGLGK